jgi:UDP-N-acetylglucosamine:LPS N-acetylglucosamine transferase
MTPDAPTPGPVRQPRVVVISASFGAGHDGAATELSRRLRARGLLVDRHDFVDLLPHCAGALLRASYRRQITTVPRTWGWLLAMARTHGFAGGAARMTALADAATADAVGADAAAVVSTYPLASQVLARLRREHRLGAPTLSYCTDMALHPLWVADGIDTHLVLHDDVARQAKHHGAADVRVVAPAVAPAFTGPAAGSAGRAARARWGLPADTPLALIVTGAWGVGNVERASQDIAATGLAVPVVACGHNDALRRRLQRHGHGIALGWVDDMAALMRACQVVVQNAGGLSSLEALTAGMPVVTYRCIPGHGRGNAQALDRAGWVPWIRTRADLPKGLQRAIADGHAFAPAALRPDTVITDFVAACAPANRAAPA